MSTLMQAEEEAACAYKHVICNPYTAGHFRIEQSNPRLRTVRLPTFKSNFFSWSCEVWFAALEGGKEMAIAFYL